MAEIQQKIDGVAKFVGTRLGKLLGSAGSVNAAQDLHDAGADRSLIQRLLSTGSGTRKDPNLAKYYSDKVNQ